jgi:hypothetical protein
MNKFNIKLNPKKCKLLKIDKDGGKTFPLEDESTHEAAQLDSINERKVISIFRCSP